MATNSEKYNQKARQKIDEIIIKVLPTIPEGITMNSIIRQILLTYPVSETMIKKFIEECYIKEGIITNYNGILKTSKI